LIMECISTRYRHVVQPVGHPADGSLERFAQRQVHVGPDYEVSRGHGRGDGKTTEADGVCLHVG
jgi:hypothetical protein